MVATSGKHRVLFADNEETFLNELLRLNEKEGSSTLNCLTLLLPKTASADELFDLLCKTLKKERPDLLLMDINLPGASGTDGMALVKKLRETICPYADDLPTLPPLRPNDPDQQRHPWLDLPVVLMTQDAYANTQARFEAVGEHVEAVIFGKKQEPCLLHLVEVSLPSWCQLARERMWSQLDRRLAGWLADRALHHAETALRTLLFLHGHLGMAHCFVRLERPETPGDLGLIAKIKGPWADDNNILRVDDVPVLGDVLTEPKGFRHDNLPTEKAGKIPQIAGLPVLGVRLWYADAAIGYIAAVGGKDDPAFTQRELDHLLTVANSLAAVCGRANRQRHLLDGAHDYSLALADCPDEKSVMEVLARTAQKALQTRGMGKKHETSVRLIEPGTYRMLQRVCLLEDDGCVLNPDILLDTKPSVIAWVVREGKPWLSPDVRDDSLFLEGCKWVNAELCVPLLYGGVALGAVNLEHEAVGYYDNTDMRQLSILANQAALAISRLREHRFANALLDWAIEAESLIQPADIWPKIYDSLFEYSGYGCLLHCVPLEVEGQLWRVRKVAVYDDRLREVNRNADAWSEKMAEDWLNPRKIESTSFLRRWLREGRHEVEFQREVGRFLPIQDKGLLPVEDKADAIIPLLAEGGHRLRGLLLLFWFHAPPWSDEYKAMLDRLGRYGGELMDREQREAEAQRERHELEDLAIYGEVLRQFQHLYRNARGGLDNWDNDILAEANILERNGADTRRLREGMEKLIAAIHALPPIERITAYMHDPKPVATSPAQAWARITGELQAKADRVQAQIVAPQTDIPVLADPVILELILYMLLDNALDALAGIAAPRQVALKLEIRDDDRVVLAVQDSGPGVTDSMRASLFEKFNTSKSGGLGSGLCIARRRARAMQGDLRLEESATGARFELELPSAGQGTSP